MYLIKSFTNNIFSLFSRKPKTAPIPTELNGIPISRIKKLMYYKSPNTFRLSDEEMEAALLPSRVALNTACTKGPFDVNFDVIDMHNEYRHLNTKKIEEIIIENNKTVGEVLQRQENSLNKKGNFIIRHCPKIKINNENS